MSKKSKKYVHEGFSWNLRGPIDEKSKAFVLAAYTWIFFMTQTKYGHLTKCANIWIPHSLIYISPRKLILVSMHMFWGLSNTLIGLFFQFLYPCFLQFECDQNLIGIYNTIQLNRFKYMLLFSNITFNNHYSCLIKEYALFLFYHVDNSSCYLLLIPEF